MSCLTLLGWAGSGLGDFSGSGYGVVSISLRKWVLQALCLAGADGAPVGRPAIGPVSVFVAEMAVLGRSTSGSIRGFFGSFRRQKWLSCVPVSRATRFVAVSLMLNPFSSDMGVEGVWKSGNPLGSRTDV